MLKEDYVSFETAKMLREKGFEESCNCYYEDYGKSQHLFYKEKQGAFNIGFKQQDDLARRFEGVDKGNYKCAAPTLQMAMKWLRKAHNIHIAIVPCEVGPGVMDYTYILYKIDTENFFFKDLEIQGRANTDKMSASKTCEAAIKYCLENLI